MLAFDQDAPAGWYRVRWGLWKNAQTGETWRSWKAYGPRAGHYPGYSLAKQIARQARAAESRFAVQLRQVGTVIGHIVRGTFNADNPEDPGWATIEDQLARYKELLRPWAESTATRMLADVSRRDASGWHALGKQIGRALRKEIDSAPTQSAMTDLYNYTVQQIVNLPDTATDKLRKSREFSARIVSEMRGPAEQALAAGRRWESLVKDVRDAGLHVQSSAATVARTETARAATTLQTVRAKHIGVELFQWLTADDFEVRPLHQKIANTSVGYGKGIYRLDDPPILDDGRPGLPGTIYNCRCYLMPILPVLPD